MAKKKDAPVYRKAIMKKAKNYKFGKRLGKGEEVLIKEEFVGHSRYVYTAVRKETDTIQFGVTRSEFEYTEDEEFVVHVTRISYASRNIVVKAKDRKEAERLANEEAGGYDFKEHDADYKTDMPISMAEHKKMFPNSDINN